MLFFRRCIRDGGFFAALGGFLAEAIFGDTEFGEITLGRLGAALTEFDVVLASPAFVGMAFDQDLFVAHLSDAIEVFLEGVGGIAADRSPIEVKIDLVKIAGGIDASIAIAFFACRTRLACRTPPGTLGFARTGTCFFADLLGGTVAVLGTRRGFRGTSVALTDLAGIAIAGGIAVVFADPLASEGCRIATLALLASNVGARFVDALVTFALLALGIAAIIPIAALLALALDTEKVPFVLIAFFVCAAVFVVAALRPRGFARQNNEQGEACERKQKEFAHESRGGHGGHRDLLHCRRYHGGKR